MSLQLHLLRHAKSSWADPGASDRERELNHRGLRDAPRMGRALSDLVPPQPLSVSLARRAQATLEGLIEGWPELREMEHRTEEALYTFSAAELVDWIGEQPGDAETLFIVGHNPALTELPNWLTGEPVFGNVPTAGYVGLELDCDTWSELWPGCGRVVRSLFPRELADG